MALKFLNDGYFAGKVGIGTDSPSAKLHLAGAGAPDIRIQDTNGTNQYGDRGHTNGQTTYVSRNNNTFGSHVFYSADGTTTQARVVFSQDFGTGSSMVTATGAAGNSYGGFLAVSSVATAQMWASDSGIIYIGSRSNHNINFTINNQVKAIINTSGNVGIGTTSPVAKLDVLGTSGGPTVFDYAYATNAGLRIHGDESAMDIVGADSGNHASTILLRNGNEGFGLLNNPNLNTLQFRSFTATADGFNIHHTGSGLSSLVDIITLEKTGNVGIGTTSPLGKLQVNEYTVASQGNQNVHGELSVFANSGDESLFLGVRNAAYPNRGWAFNPVVSGVNSDLQIKEHGSTGVRMTLESGGNVGIGTTSPGTALQVGGLDDGSNYDITLGWNAVSSQAVGTKRSALTFKTSQTGVNNEDIYKWDIAMVTAPATASNEPFGSNLAFLRSTRSSTSVDETTMILTQLGNVGIGTDSPTSKLTISSDIAGDGSWNDSGILIENTSTTTGEPTLSFRNAGAAGTGSNYWHTGLNQSNTYKIAYGTSFTDGNTKLELATDGGLRLNSYTQGFLQTDANGNVSTSGGGVLPGGPYLPLAGGTMTGTNGVLMPDNFKLKFGDATTPDLQIYHDGSNSYIKETGTGTLNLQGSTQVLIGGTNGEVGVQYVENAGVGLRHNNVTKLTTESTGINVVGDIKIDSALLSNQENTDVDTGTETVAQVSTTDYTAAFFDFVIKKTTNVRSGTVYACHDGTNVEFTETSTQDLGDTSDVTLSVDISGGNMRLRATTTSDDWSIKSLIRAI